ncbi:beta-N-acetylhexosaminidase [uncultured Tessaracoccus sp.]|uniref:beta-N-acetylhexosaminidase n=1 Tax=uncultured Tessaracoccus sp. TaxID=905023 RepID=UPI0025D14419|nr:beta-N-acetylhexosaminidase [uncultured Tessaracoccus sp.]
MSSVVIPLPRAWSATGGELAVPPELTVAGDDEALVAARPFVRALEDCGAVTAVARADDGFLRLVTEASDDESYRITVDDGVELRGGPQGLRWGAQTLRAMLPAACLMPGSGARAVLPRGVLRDAPAHPWRGLLIDVARHWMPVTWLRRVVDIAAFHKLNRLHLHLTDDQGWRMPVAAYARLTTVGARRRETLVGPAPGDRYDGVPHGGAYTRAELEALVAHAREQGVTIVPEIDLPGHMVAAIAAYPEWGNHPDPVEVMTTWGISSTIINTRPGTLDALRTILDEVMDVFDSPWIHLGGDEVPTTEWEASLEVARLMEREGIDEVRGVQGWIMDQLLDHVRRAGRTPVVWGEAMDAGITGDVVVQAWTEPSQVERALARGHRTVASPQQHWYLNWSAAQGDDEPLGFGVGKGLATSVEDAWAYRVPDGLHGVEGALWAEYVTTPEEASYHLLPRLAVVAERAWAGNADDWAGFRRRLEAQVRRYEQLGWDHRPLTGPGPRWSRTWTDGDGGAARARRRADIHG